MNRFRTAVVCCLAVGILVIGLSFSGMAVTRGLFISGPGNGAGVFWNEINELAQCCVRSAGWGPIWVGFAPTQAQLVNWIRMAFGGSTDDDINVLVFSCHAGKWKDQNGDEITGMVAGTALDESDEFLALAQGILDDSFGAGAVARALAGVQGATVIVVDACYSGGLAGGALDLPITNTMLLDSCAENERSSFNIGPIAAHAHSWFLGSLISGLLQDPAAAGFAWADGNADRIVSISEWMVFASPKVTRIAAGAQTPGLSFLPGDAGLVNTPIQNLGALWLHRHKDPESEGVTSTNFPAGFSPVAEAIYDKLIDIDQAGNLTPEIAESWKVNDEGTMLTFHLRECLFSDGTSVTAELVARNLKEPTVLLDLAFGPLLFRPSLVEAGLIKDLTAPNANTLEIRLADGVSPEDFLYCLTNIAGMIALPDHPGEMIGTGPFKFVEWVPESRVTVERNDDYWGEKSKASKLIFKDVQETATLELLLVMGEVHIAQLCGYSYYEHLQFVEHIRLYNPPAPYVFEEDGVIIDYRLFTAVRDEVNDDFLYYSDHMLRLDQVTPPDGHDTLVVGLVDGW